MSERGKILVYCEHFPAITETFIVEHVLGLHRSGWDVRIACLTWNEELWREISADRLDGAPSSDFLSVEIEPHLNRLKDSTISRQLYLWSQFGVFHGGRVKGLMRRDRIRAAVLHESVSREKPDVVHAHFGPNAVHAAVALHGTDIPLIADFHGYDATSFPAKRGWGLFRQYLGGASAVVHSEFVARQISEGIGLEPTLVHYGLKPDRFKMTERGDAWPESVKLLHAGRLTYQKGQETAMRALQLLDDREYSLTIIGDGEDRQMLEKLRDELGQQSRVHFTGALSHDELAAQMGQHDIVVVPSRQSPSGWQEAFCLVAAEGMAMGLGVVGTRTGGLGDTIGPGGVVVEPDNVEALAEGVRKLMKEGSPRDWAKRGAEQAARYDFEKMREGYDRVASEAVAKHGS